MLPAGLTPTFRPLEAHYLDADVLVDAFAACADLATGVLAILALLTVRARPLFWLFVVITHIAAFYMLLRPSARRAPV